jgi:uncharacterized surface protein with fasciclin (FAS1) repeats
MKKTLIAFTTLAAITLAGTASAQCAFNKAPGHAGAYMPGMSSGVEHGAFIKVGGYSKAQQTPDIVDTAVSAGSFNTLVKAVQEAGLVATLKGEGPFTVFAPTDAAFAKLPAGTLEALLADKTKLTQILTYHVVPGRLDARAVTSMSSLATVEGSALPVSSIRIAATDIMTSNGIIHVIDEVLIPSS